jgi:hypothetical protein
MCLIATPDFGVSGCIALLAMLAWLVAFGVACLGVWLGARLWLRCNSTPLRRFGLILMVLFGAIPVASTLLPPLWLRANYGNYPVSSRNSKDITEEMTQQEVQSKLGTPHDRCADGLGDRW